MADETTKTTENNASGNASTFNISAAFFGAPAESESDKGEQDSTEASLNGAETATDDVSDDGEQDAGDSEPGEEVEVWQFNGAEYTSEQVSAALKNNATFERFNQSIAPLVENIKQYGETAERLKVLGTTECDNQINELNKALASGRLNAKEYQEAHQLLTKAMQRKEVLETAAAQEAQRRKQALEQADAHNVRQVTSALVKAGWSKADMDGAQLMAQQSGLTKEQFRAALSVGFMEILKDAAELRASKGKAAAALRDKAIKAIKVGSKAPSQAVTKVKKSKVGDSDWMSKTFWGGKA